ncbi:DUF2330 domain-containing protein [Polyangium spumosum]|uniref:DUF2330 domain-containing protein n=1 Tax=Polyangium spumosum TaxID=889282 RepID=A0A6N7PLN7_9BACT|nr:DUF2330 domain-containing protein [Polyangium spumosum]MRG92938.1 DUF2330 domain-containing protein [Polyangium spumosum]
MLLRLLPLTGLVAITTLAMTQRADAAGAWLPSGPSEPIEARVAVAVGPTRSTLWTSLRVDGVEEPFAIVVPVSPGAALDHSSDAWFEALASATAPRVLGPVGVSPVCPGEAPSAADLFHVTESLDPSGSVAPVESVLLKDAQAVVAWATQRGLEVSPDLAVTLGGMAGKRFFAERYNAPNAKFVTSTLRVVSPTPEAALPLALTRAGSTELRVTAWMIGDGRAALAGSKPITLPMSELSWKAASADSNYKVLRADELRVGGPSAALIEAASHDAFVMNEPIANGTSSITGVVTSFFQRAAGYGDGDTNASPCITAAAVALDDVYPVAESCPRAELGVVDGSLACAEVPAGGEIDPEKLRCGGITDDLAVGFAGMVPRDVVLTRVTMLIPATKAGSTWPVTFEPAAPDVKPLLTAQSLDLASCNTSSSSTSTSAGSSSSSGGQQGGSNGAGAGVGAGAGGSAGYYDDDYDDVGCACVGTAEPIVDDTTETYDDGYYDDTSSEDCGGDTSDTYDDSYYDDTSSEDCGGDTSDTYDDGYYDDTSSDDCGGDTSDTYDDGYYDDTSSEDCGGDTSDDDSSSSDSCSGDTDDGGDDWDDDWGDWEEEARAPSSAARRVATIDASRHDETSSMAHRAHAKKLRKRGPKASVITLGLLAILAPLRRLARPDRSRRSAKDKPRRERSSS